MLKQCKGVVHPAPILERSCKAEAIIKKFARFENNFTLRQEGLSEVVDDGPKDVGPSVATGGTRLRVKSPEVVPDAEEMAKRSPNRWDCPGIMMIGDQVIWDGEAEYLGIEALTTIPVADYLKDDVPTIYD